MHLSLIRFVYLRSQGSSICYLRLNVTDASYIEEHRPPVQKQKCVTGIRLNFVQALLLTLKHIRRVSNIVKVPGCCVFTDYE